MEKTCCKCCPKVKEEKFKIKTTDELLSLLNFYYTELTHRDKMFYTQIFTYFFACLIVMLLPFAQPLELDFDGKIPAYVLIGFGMVLSFAFLLISRAYVVRLEAIGNTCNNLMKMLPKKYQRISISSINSHKFYGLRMTSFITWVMFISLIVIGAILLVISYGQG